MKIALLLLCIQLLTLSWGALALDYKTDPNQISEVFGVSTKIDDELEIIKQLPPSEYYQKIDSYRTSVEKYIEHKKRVCNGEFSTQILKDSRASDSDDDTDNDTLEKSPTQTKHKLSAAERKLCFREMKTIQITFINNIFLARTKYLNYQHKLRLQKLEKEKDETIKNFRARFKKSTSTRSKKYKR
ncbi:MAG: hypothetical protein ISR65_08200 [Bacteriovoracaceae bacterium]|nr:hypothetical protein [Bacteriovoracaceae bacterium]